MAKKDYEKLKLKLVVFDYDDVITSSGGDSNDDPNENGFDLGADGDFWS